MTFSSVDYLVSAGGGMCCEPMTTALKQLTDRTTTDRRSGPVLGSHWSPLSFVLFHSHPHPSTSPLSLGVLHNRMLAVGYVTRSLTSRSMSVVALVVRTTTPHNQPSSSVRGRATETTKKHLPAAAAVESVESHLVPHPATV
ncbi:hypothetical protein CBL_10488 [Carabus blaptoides fortunei]